MQGDERELSIRTTREQLEHIKKAIEAYMPKNEIDQLVNEIKLNARKPLDGAPPGSRFNVEQLERETARRRATSGH